MSDAAKAFALLHGINRHDIDAMKPEQRKRFAALCRHVAEMAETTVTHAKIKSGVLFDLRNGAPRHE
jgi:hypothetical protein